MDNNGLHLLQIAYKMHNKVLVTGMSLHCIVRVYREVNNYVMLYFKWKVAIMF